MHHSTSQSENEIAVALIVPPLASDKTHSIEYGSITLEMVNRFTHTHVFVAYDNAKVFNDLKLATRNTKYASSVAPFKKTNNVRGA